MRTLDEVIKAYEICHASVLSCEGCPYDNGERWRDSDCYLTDALYYLKEYRKHLAQESDELRQKIYELKLLQEKPWEKRQ